MGSTTETYFNEFTKVDDDKGILIFCPKGFLDIKDLKDLTKKCRKVAYDKGYKLIMDFTDFDTPIGVYSAHKWFEENYSEEEYHLKRVPTVHIANQNYREVFEHIDWAWPKEGIDTRAFQKKLQAFRWLIKQDEN